MAPAEAVLEHLRYHKAFVDASEQELARIDEYMAMVEGELRAFSDPYDKAIALAFQLVLQEQLDPWAIDLSAFCERYIERVRLTRDIDLVTAGRILLLAWNVLRIQADDLLKRAEPPKREEADPFAWDALPVYDPDDPALQDFTTAVLSAPRAPLSESILHDGERRVTLFELVEALDEARREVEVRELLAERLALEEAYASAGKNRVHREDLESEIRDVWALLEHRADPVPLDELHDGTRWGFLTAFVALLFLSRDGKVRLRQEDFPAGPVFVDVVPEAERPAPPAPAPLVSAASAPGIAPPAGGAQEVHDDDA